MRKSLLSIALAIAAVSLYAQTGSISGTVKDSTLKKTYSLATVTVFAASDTSIITYRLSDETGQFKIPGLPLNKALRFIVSYSGYASYRKEFQLTNVNSQLRFDSIVLKPLGKNMDEVVIVAERPPVIIKKDTIEFNASAFKTLPNALVEDLLKKLPGVQVDGEGNITVNGKAVNRILVDGKSFFGDDPKMASRNLPANVIDKVQVTDDKDQQLMSGSLNSNDVGKVVNITLKKSIKKGWFGKIYGGGGTEETYEAGAIANIYRDTLQLSVLAYANNLNKPGFNTSELLQTGGLSRNQSNGAAGSISISSSAQGSATFINGINFGGMQGNGITTSKGAGININHTPNARRSFFAQYFYGGTNLNRSTDNNLLQFFGDTTVTNNTKQNGNAITNTHNIGIGLRLKPDSVTSLLVSANYTLSFFNEERLNLVINNNNKYGKLSEGNIRQANDATSTAYRQSINFYKLSRTKKNRRFVVNHNLDWSNRAGDFITEGENNFFYPNLGTYRINQLRNDGSPRVDTLLLAYYDEPLTKKLMFRIQSQLEYGQNKNEINTYEQSASMKFDSLIYDLSSSLNRKTAKAVNSLLLVYKIKGFTLTPGLRSFAQTSEVKTPFLLKPFRQSGHNFGASLNIVYKQLSILYDKGVVLPGYQYMIATVNNSDPYFVVKPNPNLLPSIRHNFSVNYYYNNQKKNLSVFVFGQSTLSKNDIVESITVDNKGIQTTMPINANGSNRSTFNYSITKQYKYNQKFSLTSNIGGYYSYNRSRLFFNDINSWQNTYSLFHWASLYLNWNDKFEWNNSYQLGNNFTRYTSNRLAEINLANYDLTTELVLRYPKHVIWETKLGWTKYATTAAGFPAHVLRWTAGINFTMLKDEKGVLSIRAYDLLNQNNSVSTSVSRNMISVINSNVLPRYFMATFTYNVRAINAAKRKVGGSLFNF